MSIKTILGIDIGMTGALAFYDKAELIIYDMPIFKVAKGNDIDIYRLQKIIKEQKPDEVFIEKAILMPSNGKTAYQKLGKCEGAILGILATLEIPYSVITPAKWKKEMGCPKAKDGARKRATELLPQFSHNWDRKKDDGRAEASLIALWAFGKKQ